jgi:hypothetical protein
MCGGIPGSDVVSDMDSEQHRPLIVQLYRCRDAGLCVAIHDAVREITRSEVTPRGVATLAPRSRSA